MNVFLLTIVILVASIPDLRADDDDDMGDETAIKHYICKNLKPKESRYCRSRRLFYRAICHLIKVNCDEPSLCQQFEKLSSLSCRDFEETCEQYSTPKFGCKYSFSILWKRCKCEKEKKKKLKKLEKYKACCTQATAPPTSPTTAPPTPTPTDPPTPPPTDPPTSPPTDPPTPPPTDPPTPPPTDPPTSPPTDPPTPPPTDPPTPTPTDSPTPPSTTLPETIQGDFANACGATCARTDSNLCQPGSDTGVCFFSNTDPRANQYTCCEL